MVSMRAYDRARDGKLQHFDSHTRSAAESAGHDGSIGFGEDSLMRRERGGGLAIFVML
jgi:hypothetical protein